MEFASSRRDWKIAPVVFLLTASMVWFGNGLHPLWPVLWFAPLPVLLFALRSSWRSAAAVAAISWLAGCGSLREALHAPLAVWFAVFSLSAIVFAAAVLLFRALVRLGALWTALAAFPAAWVSYEYARNLATPHGTAGCLAYSQLNFLPFLQLASITGPWGMSFLLLLFPAGIAVALHERRSHPRKAVRIAATSIGTVALVLLFGAVRLAVPGSPDRTVRVGLIASDQAQIGGVAGPGAATERLFRDYANEAEKLASQGARVIVLPEKIGVVLDANAPAADAVFQRVADEANVTIVTGEVAVAKGAKYNRARVYRPGAPVESYDKHHLLPPFESNLTPGAALLLLPERRQTWGVTICKDMDFTRLSRKYGREGAGLMLVPAWDFGLDRWWHGHIAVMRGVEDGFSIVRAAKDGNLTVSDDRGRILAETRSDSASFATLVTETPATHEATVYLALGDWFAWFSLAALTASLGQLLRLRRRLFTPSDIGIELHRNANQSVQA